MRRPNGIRKGWGIRIRLLLAYNKFTVIKSAWGVQNTREREGGKEWKQDVESPKAFLSIRNLVLANDRRIKSSVLKLGVYNQHMCSHFHPMKR